MGPIEVRQNDCQELAFGQVIDMSYSHVMRLLLKEEKN